jgi:hypothetical protein
MKTYKMAQQDIQVVYSMTCDKCHKLIEIDNCGCGEAVELVVNAGYGSRFDCVMPETAPEFDLCDKCCEELMKSLGWQIEWPNDDEP